MKPITVYLLSVLMVGLGVAAIVLTTTSRFSIHSSEQIVVLCVSGQGVEGELLAFRRKTLEEAMWNCRRSIDVPNIATFHDRSELYCVPDRCKE